MGTRLSGSRLPIAQHCGWAFRNDVKYPEESESLRGNANAGNVKHNYLAEFIDHGVFPPLKGVDKLYAEAVKNWWVKLGRGHNADGWRAEVAYALDIQKPTSICLGAHMGRDYSSVSDCDIPLTVDYEGIENGIYVVGDFKTGPGGGLHVEPPESNLQLLAGACAGSMYYDSQGKLTSMGAKIEIAHVGEDNVYPQVYIASPFALMKALEDFKAIKAKIPNATAVPGEHCTYCPARGACPAISDLANKAAQTRQFPVDLRATWTTEALGEENDSLLIDELAAIKKAIEAVEASLKDRYRNSPLHLRDGKIYKLIVCSKNSFDKDKATELLGDKYKDCLKPIEYEQFRRVKS